MRSVLAVVFLSGCIDAPYAQLVQCTADNQCGGTQVCFASGCGDPGTGLVVEVTGNGVSLHAQDIAIPSLSATQPLEVRGPLSIAGTLLQDLPERSGTVEFIGGVTISARGESILIPGLTRSYSQVLPRVDHGVYQMFVGSGRYTVTARPTDPAIPYQSIKGVVVAPGSVGGGAAFNFPAFDSTLYLTGTLLSRVEPGHPEKLIFQDGMSIQAFETAGGTPLSQIAKVSSSGVFTLALDFGAANLNSIALVATPYDNNALAPTKTFILSPVPTTAAIGRLELGDFGSPLPKVSGRIVTAGGMPIANATVTFDGVVGGGGTFKSANVATDAEGRFSVDLLPTPANAPYTLTAIPPPQSRSGILQTQIRAGLLNGEPALLEKVDSTEATVDFKCPDRLVTTGSVMGPDGNPSAKVTVVAIAVEALDKRPLPTRASTTETDANGAFELLLDPAKYRIDYVPQLVARLPRKSRLVRIEPYTDVDAGTLTGQDLGAFTLTVGRTVAGQVTIRQNIVDVDGGMGNVGGGTAAPNAVVRFYRVTSVEGVDSALLIGESFTDEMGNYSVVLPDRVAATAGP